MDKKATLIPDKVIEAFNEMIAQNCSNGSSTFTQKEVVALIVSKGIDEDQLLDNRWLDVEGIYRKADWSVKYDKPGFNETYDATFTFSKKRKR